MAQRRGDGHRLVRWLWTSRRFDARAARALLVPASGLWGTAMRVRASAYRRGWCATHDLPLPFLVFATQNPIEQEGTYPLPEAQLDRFLLEVQVDYPDEAAERAMLLATTGAREARPAQAMTAAELIAAQALIRRIPVGESVLEAILGLVRNARPETSPIEQVRGQLAWGPGPRAAQALMLATRARALMDGRLAPSVEDVIALAEPVLRHRMALNFSARAEGVRLNAVIDALKARLA